MPSRRGSGEKVVRKRLADGTIREYRYSLARLETPPPGSVRALVAAWKGSPEWTALAAATRATYAVYLKPWEEDEFWSRPARAVTRREVLTIRDAIAAARGNGAAAGFARTTSALFAWALDRQWVDFSPAQRLKGPRGGHLPDWGEDAIAGALRRLPEPFRRVVVLALHTGQRRGDLARMEWGQVRGGSISVTQRKTGAALTIAVHPALAAELRAWNPDGDAEGPMLRGPRGQPWTDQHLSRAMGRQLARLGLPGLNVHGLRKAAARRLAEAGCTPHQIAAVTGHRTLAMVELYTRAADQERLAREAVSKLVARSPKPSLQVIDGKRK